MTTQHHFFARLTSLALVLVIASTACTINLDSSADPIVVTATPVEFQAAPVVITATPEATATLSPLATPEIPTDDAFTRAQRALFNGNYVLAVGQYQTLLSQNVGDANIEAAAWYGLGQAALREGLFDQAVNAFTHFIDSYPNDTRLPQAHFQRGDAYMGIGWWNQAITDFLRYLELRPSIIDSYAHERIGDAYLALEQPQFAFDHYVLAANSTRTLEPMLTLRERIAAAYVNQFRFVDAIAQYDLILEVASAPYYRASIEYQAALLEFDAGLADNAYARLQQLIVTYPETYSAYQGMIILLNAGFVVDSRLRAQISFANEDWGDAVVALNNYSTEVPTMPVESLITLGQAYRALGNWDAALTTFQTIIDLYPNDPAFGQALLEQGRTYFWSGDYVNAVNFYSSIATNYPTLPEAPEALWRTGYIYTTQLADTDRALGTFDILGQTYPGNEWAIDGLLIGAALALNNGQTQRAQLFYTQIANTATGENQALAFFWLGRLYQDKDNADAANQSFQGAAIADPGSYYSLRAEEILTGERPFNPPANYQFEFDEGAELAAAEQWLRATYGITQEGLLYPLGLNLQGDPRMIRGRELWEVGAFDDARAEFEELRIAYESDPLATYQLAHFYSQLGVYRLSIEAAARLVIDSGQSTFEVPSYIARLRYPIYYNDLVIPYSQQYELDPLLVFSLIRQESLYQGFATSFAYAQGLMQIIPDTGYWVAEQLQWPNYQNSDLYRPYVNVAFGTYYLRWTLDFVGGYEYAALAGYNGGPGNASTWLDISGPDIDRYVQTITFDETELYVTRIYEQYYAYRHLYGRDN